MVFQKSFSNQIKIHIKSVEKKTESKIQNPFFFHFPSFSQNGSNPRKKAVQILVGGTLNLRRVENFLEGMNRYCSFLILSDLDFWAILGR